MLLISSTFLLFHLSWKCINIRSSLDILLCNGKLYIEYHFTLWLWSVMFEQFLLSGFVDFIIHLFLIQITLSGMIPYQIIDDKTDMNLKILWYWKVYCSNLNADSSMNQRRNFKLQTSRLVRKNHVKVFLGRMCARKDTQHKTNNILLWSIH